ncbi:hypothetical protein Golax_021699 [Gossypium laxum]|uniref:Uncharacterized protein n=1 Tax=Gossypium laxum TaxID=34288 RepID=A0A7J9AMA7_9ROSI|nr:hypothetical protein [Gossypium laxum]
MAITRAKVGNKEVESNIISAKVGRSVQEGEVGSFNQVRVGAMVGGPKVTRRLEGPDDLGQSDEAHSVLGLREVAAPIAYGNITASYSFLFAHKGSEEVVNTIPSSKFNSSFSSNFNPMFKRMLEVPVKMKEGVLDHSKHSDVIFKENVQPNQGRKLSKTIKDRGNMFKNSSSRALLFDSVNSLVELINSQIEQENAQEDPKGDGKHLGYVNAKFPRIFKEYYLAHKLDIVRLLELRVSGRKADEIIAKLGFQHSYQVEAIEFFGGFWLGWIISVRLEVGISMQFYLQVISLEVDLVGKDAILSGNLWNQMIQHDLGFSGPLFTWNRGRTFERLDQAMGNAVWVQKFPNCRISHLTGIKSDHRPLCLISRPKLNLPVG